MESVLLWGSLRRRTWEGDGGGGGRGAGEWLEAVSGKAHSKS